jgi:hypothetical protein
MGLCNMGGPIPPRLSLMGGLIPWRISLLGGLPPQRIAVLFEVARLLSRQPQGSTLSLPHIVIQIGT